MINIGKILLFLTLLTSLVQGKLIVKFMPPVIQKGDRVDFIIETDSQNIEFPNLENISGVAVENVSTFQNHTNINGKKTLLTSRRYTLYPNHTIKAPAIKVIVNGKVYKTKEIYLRVKNKQQTKNSKYKFTIKPSKKEVYVGEEFSLELGFTVRSSANLTGLRFNINSINGIIVKSTEKEWSGKRTAEGIYYRKKYTIIPQKSGKLKIEEQPIIVQIRDARSIFGNTINTKVYSNKTEVNILPLPKDILVVGDFNIETNIAKKTIDDKEPLTATILIYGYGSLDGYEFAPPKIKGVTLYVDKTESSNEVRGGRLFSTKKIKIAFVSDKSFIIPPFLIKYFNPKTKKIETKKSKAFNIKVISKPKSLKSTKIIQPPTTQKKGIKKQNSLSTLYLLEGLFTGFLIGVLFCLKREKTEDKKKFNSKIFKINSRKDLYNQLLAFTGEGEVDEILKKLDDEFYKDIDSKIKTKDLKKLIMRLSLLYSNLKKERNEL